MVRIRAYALVLSLPFILAITGIVWHWSGGSFETGSSIFICGILLQLVLGLSVACPQCGKSPYAIGPHWGPFAFAGKPVPDRICRGCGHDFSQPLVRGEGTTPNS